jgi:integrase
MSAANPSAAIVIREHRGQAFYEAKFRYQSRQVKRRVGPAWLDLDPTTGAWRPRRGRVREGFYDERRAHVAAAEVVSAYVTQAADEERTKRERRARGVSFREVAHEYVRWLADVKGAKPSTLADYGYLLAEQGVPYKRGGGVSRGHIMAALGDRPAAKITVREIEALLAEVAATGVSARSVNKHRSIVSAIFNYGARESTFNLPANPASAADKRREPHPGPLVYYSVEEMEALARALAEGRHRKPPKHPLSQSESEVRRAEDEQDGEMVRVSAYGGLRQGETLALRWRDVDFQGHALTVARAMSGNVESSTKSGRFRRLPLSDQAAAALDRMSRRADFVDADDRVFCNHLGRTIDRSALRRRYKRAQAVAGLRPLKWHELRHTYGSLLAAAVVDTLTIKDSMGHSNLATTERYLHARPATDQAEVFTQAFQPALNLSPSQAPDAKHLRDLD